MREREQQAHQYSEVYCHGNSIASKYKPSDTLDATMAGLQERWEKFVGDLIGHLDRVLDLRTKWYTYEGGVKGLLEWIMSEAEDFSKDVTTYGEKGIKDHLDSCSVRSACLVERKEGMIDRGGRGMGEGGLHVQYTCSCM